MYTNHQTKKKKEDSVTQDHKPRKQKFMKDRKRICGVGDIVWHLIIREKATS